jgi:hypothetical protein
MMKRLAALALMAALCLAAWPVEARAGDEFRLVARQKQAGDTEAVVSLAIGAERPPVLFQVLQFQFTAMSWTDFVFTTWALKTGRYGEANPLARWYVHHTAVAMLVLTGFEFIIHYGLTELWSENKTLAWVMLVVFDVARGLVLYNNLRQLKTGT